MKKSVGREKRRQANINEGRWEGGREGRWEGGRGGGRMKRGRQLREEGNEQAQERRVMYRGNDAP